MKVGRFGLGFKSVFHVTGTYVFTDRKMGSYFFLLIEKLATTKPVSYTHLTLPTIYSV